MKLKVDFDRLASVKSKEELFRINPGTECPKEGLCLSLPQGCR